MKIIKKAMELFKKQGFDDTTMEQIAEEADVAKGTLYNHFAVKEALVSEFVQRDFQQQVHRIRELVEAQEDTKARLEVYLFELINWIKTYRELAKVYMSYRMQNMLQSLENPQQRSGSHVFVMSILGAGQEKGEIRGDFPLEILAHQFDFIRVALVKELLSEPDSPLLKRKIKKYLDLFLEGAGPSQSQ